ncbi:prolyl oligopeptidase family serine peptidase [Sphingomonas colocasiae]|uniref:Prolyl oligopeptidase family serine peptidase n=1 Tax=Sphingomonas colocasiae TaxID=1848973 RepID=A0ABS7PUT7_9SPHN|nr:prolyl oligopeptidase family serine peptidase [Sphingomonas colocasiae]
MRRTTAARRHRPFTVRTGFALGMVAGTAILISGASLRAAEVRSPASGPAAQPTPASTGDKRPYSLDDMLQLERVNEAISDPTGRWLVWEQAPPYDSVRDYSGDDQYGTRGNRLMAIDTLNPHAAPIQLGEDDGADSRWLESFSPDGRYLAYHRTTAGAYSMGVYDFETGKTSNFDAAPYLRNFSGTPAVWVSPQAFVFPAFTAGHQPIEAMRRTTGKSLWRDWNTAWSGGLSVSEVESHATSRSERPLDGRLMKVDLATGTMSTLSNALYHSIAVSHDGRFVAALRQFAKVQSDPGVADLDWVTSRSKLEIIDLRTGAVMDPAPTKDVYPNTLQWAQDRNRLAFFGWTMGAGVRSGMFHDVDVARNSVRALPHRGLDLASERERGIFQKPERAVWIRDRLAVFARALADPAANPTFTYRGPALDNVANPPARADWYLLDASGRHDNLTQSLPVASALPIDSDGRSMAVLAGGRIWRVTPGRDATPLTNAADGPLELTTAQAYESYHPPYARFAQFMVRRREGFRVLSLDLANGRQTYADFPSRSSQLLAMSGASGQGLFVTTSEDGTLVQTRRSGEPTQDVTSINDNLKQIDQTHFTTLRYAMDTSLGRREITSCMILPSGYKPGKRYPVVVDIYPGVLGRCDEPISQQYNRLGSSSTLDWHLLAARGYIVLKPNTSHFLTNRPPNPMGGMPDAVDASLDALIAQGYADPHRIGLIGVSQGGYASLWLATQMRRFKAVVSLNGWSDMYSHRFDGIIHRRYYADRLPFKGESMRYEANGIDSDTGTGVSIWDNPDAYVRNSPLFNAREITAPVMLIHSDMDVFNMNQYDMMFTALYEQKKEARYLRYAGEGHTPSSPGNVRHMWGSIFEWFDRYLADPAKPLD